ncbi:hypothetical protein J7I98_05400 [Streptomyces sp. ISL-98]|uniref:hypothetical protein n=1 Tax=Streptomyces sp. ISL-98 TaxID=2819192 RepID=UPI001BE6897E|nr:hypothetical protein [Streptomyces sp. ISL-98]MBT2505343.1 hypothetical protein [Streptomyces sp. ISL-98]
MGIESDQLVYDYLSRVGDLAQQHQLPSAARMRLVSALREEIDRQRAKPGPDSPAAVRRILGRIGSPAELVQAASGGSLPGLAERAGRSAVLPGQRDKSAEPKGRSLRIPRPRTRDKAFESPREPVAESSHAASPPHLAGTDELGPQGSEPDWWRVEPGPFGMGATVPGFVGGVEIPEILKPPPSTEPTKAEAETAEAEAEAEAEAVEKAADDAPRRWRPRLRRRTATETEPEPAPTAASRPPPNLVLLLAAALLVGGAVFRNWLALGGGWLLAYASQRISRAQAKWAVLGLPGLVATGGVVWLWGRTDGRWGEPIAQGAMGEAVSGMWPEVVQAAAVASALYLVWRARRR